MRLERWTLGREYTNQLLDGPRGQVKGFGFKQRATESQWRVQKHRTDKILFTCGCSQRRIKRGETPGRAVVGTGAREQVMPVGRKESVRPREVLGREVKAQWGRTRGETLGDCWPYTRPFSKRPVCILNSRPLHNNPMKYPLLFPSNEEAIELLGV